MSMASDLYQQVILEHNKKPRNFRKLEPASHSAEGFNPLCGDHLWVYLQVDESQATIEAVSFEGSGCAISKASASMMTAALQGKSTAEARELSDAFVALVKGDSKGTDGNEVLGKLKIFSGIWQYPSRVKCAALAWHAMRGALDDNHKVSTE